ncbi:MAG: NAD(P)H-dependent oxidoreductase [Lactobacillus sp.]|nr:MAG: NAD(P)H-dependent oxidoreductase [Lactobacillus sp.]
MKFIGIVGSNADQSTNRTLLNYMQRHFSQVATIEICEIKDLPAFNEPDSKIAPREIQAIIDQIQAADGVIISTPEYDHSIPAALKSLIEWLSYTSEAFNNCPVMITGASHGTLGSSRAQNHLRQILDAPEVGARVLPSSEFLLGGSLRAFDDAGNLVDVAKIHELERDFTEYLAFAQDVNQLIAHSSQLHDKQVVWTAE